MKKVLALLFLASSAHAVCSGYANQRQLTISTFSVTVPQMVTNVFGTVSNFPVLVTTTSVIYSTAAGTGQLLNSNGYDLTYSADNACATMLNFDTETVIVAGIQSVYNAWVQVPTLSTATATAATFYQNWGNAAITSYVGHSTGVWDSSFTGVYHLANGTTLNLNDSTSNGNAGTNTTAMAAATGEIDGAASSPGTTNRVVVPTAVYPTNSNLTFSAWVKITQSAALKGVWRIDASLNSFFVYINGSNVVRFDDGATSITGGTTLSSATWYYVVATGGGSGSQPMAIYVNGASDGTGASIQQNGAPSAAYFGGDPFGQFLNGSIDEARISNAVRNSDWIKAEYNTVNSSSTFVSYGAIQTSGSGPANRGLFIQGAKVQIL
jgi:hypothetical protein